MTTESMYESLALSSHGCSLGIGLQLGDSLSIVSGRRLLQHLFAYVCLARSTQHSFRSLIFNGTIISILFDFGLRPL